jgi:hypothetical protein
MASTGRSIPSSARNFWTDQRYGRTRRERASIQKDPPGLRTRPICGVPVHVLGKYVLKEVDLKGENLSEFAVSEYQTRSQSSFFDGPEGLVEDVATVRVFNACLHAVELHAIES